MGHYATTLIELHVRAVRRCSTRWALPEPRLADDGNSFEMTASEVRAWVTYFEENYENPQKIDGPTFLACTVMENIARDYISRASDAAPKTQPERIIYLRKATEEFRLSFM